MSGRPANPSYTPVVWDSGNYAVSGDAWSATPKRVDPGYRFWTPKLKGAGQFVNFFFGSILDVQATAKTDATNALNLVGQDPALNWLPKTTSSATKNCNRGAWSTVDQAWFIVGNGGTDYAAVSYDFGRTWADLATASTTALVDVAVDASGNVVFIATATRSTTKCTHTGYAAFTFATTANALTVAPSGGALTFDTSHTKFIACYRNGILGHKVDTSTLGVAWVAQTIPAAWTAYTGTNSPLVAADHGTAIACFYDDTAGVLRVMRSTDGGTTWAATGTLNTTFAGALVHRATYDSINAVWWIAYSTTAGSRQTELVRSTDDGATWTAQFKLFTGANDLFCNGMIALGALLVMANDDGRIAWSTDGTAASWFWAGRNPQTTAGVAATPLGLRSGGGGLLLLNAPDRVAYASIRFGNDGQAV